MSIRVRFHRGPKCFVFVLPALSVDWDKSPKGNDCSWLDVTLELSWLFWSVSLSVEYYSE